MPATLTAQPYLRPFRASDLDSLMNRDGEQVSQQAIIDQALAGPAVTGLIDGRPIGCAGLVLPWPGIGMAWMVLSEEMGDHGIWLTRTVAHFLRDMVQRHDLHRLEAVALVGAAKNHAWLERLGFHAERDGIARAFLSDRRSVVRYEWVKE